MSARPQRFVIFGLTPLAYAVARRLSELDGEREVVVIPGRPEKPVPAEELPDAVEVLDATLGREEALQRARLDETQCLLSLTDDSVENLRTIVAAWQQEPQTEVVVETFDQALADQLERKGLGSGQRYKRRVHRAYSEAALAAPYFVAEALESENLLTLRLGDRQLPFYRTPLSPESPLAGMSVGDLEREYDCSVLARSRADAWDVAPALDQPVGEGETLLLSGMSSGVVKAASRNSPTARTVSSALQKTASGVGRLVSGFHSWLQGAIDFARKRAFGAWLTLALLLLVILAVLVVEPPHREVGGVLDRMNAAVRTALGEENYWDTPGLEKLIAIAAIVAGTALVAIVTSQLAAIATKERVDPEAGAQRLVQHMRGHVIVAGLGELGYRITRLLCQADVRCVVISPSSDDDYFGAVETLAPILTGSIRLEENLKRANIDAAAALIACSGDRLANVEACMRAERLALETERPLRTVARIFRDSWAAEAAEGFELDSSLSSAEVAARTFAESASGLDGANRIELDDMGLVARRVKVLETITREQHERWRGRGVLLVAVVQQPSGGGGLGLLQTEARTGARFVKPGGKAEALERDDELLVVGPADAVEALRSVAPA